MSASKERAMTAPQIVRLVDLEARSEAAADSLAIAIDGIFFEASGRTFHDQAKRAEFHELWLGQYLRHDRRHVWLAVDGQNDPIVLGYLAGSLIDPAASDRFAALPYFKAIAEPCGKFPAHLHINLAPAARNRGIGRLLVDAFCAEAKAEGAKGVHVVTAAAARNVGFYRRAGFDEAARCEWNGRTLVMLVRPV